MQHNDLGYIAMLKGMLAPNLRGWVNALDLYVQERRVGNLTRLQAGGKYQSYFDAWCEEGKWGIRKFYQDTWDRRFADVSNPHP